MNRTTKVILAVAVSVIILSVGFIGGFAMSKISPAIGSLSPIPSPDAARSNVGSAVDEINQLLKERALEPPSETSATAGAIQGLLESGGDKYASYFDTKHYKAFNEETMGAFGGIGVVLGENKDGQAYVVEVYKDTPAQRAGMKAGDVFASIDGVKRAKWTSEEVVKRVRGEDGTKVKLVMSRPVKDGARRARGRPLRDHAREDQLPQHQVREDRRCRLHPARAVQRQGGRRHQEGGRGPHQAGRQGLRARPA